MAERKVRVRFAPSPTGALHIGGVRTALYNYLFARQHGGDLIFRIEDTDSNRFVPGAEEYILESFKWLGIHFDEGVSFGGEHGPYRQSERREIYKKYVQILLDNDKAYIAFDTPEELDAKRAEIANFQYDASTRGMMRNSLTMPKEEVDALKIQGVPSVYANGKLLHVGRGTLGELLQKLEEMFGSEPMGNAESISRTYDVLVLGGGPAGASAAIYSARKGLRVAIVAEKVGGQVKETVGIENLISVPQTTGAQLADNLRSHINHYPIDLFEDRKIEKAELQGKEKRISVVGGEVFISPSVIIATGASWRKLNVEGETEYIGRGVAFCPHCDGPFYQGKDIAVIGGGNSGIEAAIDLAGICRKVTVFEFADTLKADQVLQEKAQSLPNVEIFTSSQTTKVVGNGDKVTAIRVKDRVSSEERDFPLDGIFVQIGLAANSAPFRDMLETTPIGEIKIDAFCRTTLPGVYAAGDVSDVPYKQIVIAMGEGAKAALSAFDDRIRGIA